VGYYDGFLRRFSGMDQKSEFAATLARLDVVNEVVLAIASARVPTRVPGNDRTLEYARILVTIIRMAFATV